MKNHNRRLSEQAGGACHDERQSHRRGSHFIFPSLKKVRVGARRVDEMGFGKTKAPLPGLSFILLCRDAMNLGVT
jgi:hypothetical protein